MSNHFTLDGVTVPFTTGQTIMDAALKAGIYIPHLCHNPEFTPHGSCRLCTVSVNGRNVAACTTPAADNMQVENETHELTTQRRLLLKLLFVEGNHACPACEKSGACQLQAVAYHCGMLAPEFIHFYPKRAVDASHKETLIDFNRCILCELCVRASLDVDKKNVFAISGRGIHSHLTINSPSGKLGDSDFTTSDKAARVCPVGAILPKHKGYNKPIGKRLYDQSSISQVGDVAQHQEAADE
ncbi:MAG: 2Fe-2S iron-sulfur cluster-binding protein [Sedimenticola sp.]|nr:2Fe-2S iron-sulfur cluster-binding protein [Sedimenticola sp.]